MLVCSELHHVGRAMSARPGRRCSGGLKAARVDYFTVAFATTTTTTDNSLPGRANDIQRVAMPPSIYNHYASPVGQDLWPHKTAVYAWIGLWGASGRPPCRFRDLG